MRYPGRVIRAGETDAPLIEAIILQLRNRGYAQPVQSKALDAGLSSLIKVFQAQNVDAAGRPLKVDGQVGPLTWGALFGAVTSPIKATGLAGKALAKAITQLGVREKPPGSNSGPEVNDFLKAVNLGPGYFWCMAFIYWCFRQAAEEADMPNPFPKTAGCLHAWNTVKAASPKKVITKAQAVAQPSLVRPGLVFILDYGAGAGHTGFVRHSVGGALKTIEGNTNLSGSGNGVGVFELNRRNIMDKGLKGFLDFN